MAAIVRVGPWGGEGGNPWDDGVHSGIHTIKICYDGVAIDSIQIGYDNDGNLFWSEEHGGNTRNNGEQVQFDCPTEILTLISGFHDIYIRTLACESNCDRYGPYGIQRENNFESPRGQWKIVGFHGRSDGYLRSIGVYLSNLNVEGCFPPICPFPGPEPEPILVGSSFPGLKLISVGPWGGDGGDSSHALKLISVGPWGGDGGDTWDDVLYSGIHKIRVGYDRCAIVSIHIEYDNNGSTVWKEHGRSQHDEEIELDYPQEILTSISGYYDTYLRSLTFESNFKKKYGPYGSEEGTCFSFPISDGKIVSFYGRSDEYLRSIGVHLQNLHAAVPPLSLERISFVPWGGQAVDDWDDGVYSGIRQIIVVYGDGAINCIHIRYDNNGSPFRLEHGGRGGNKIQKIQLNYPTEILTKISGHYDSYLRSLTFETNEQKYGPYGSERGTSFEFPNGDAKIVGFHGRSDEHLRSIGVYYLPNKHTAVPPKEYLGEVEPALIVGESLYASEEEPFSVSEPDSPSEGEHAIIEGGSSFGSARKARLAAKKDKKKAKRKKKEGSRAREEEDTRAFELSEKPKPVGPWGGNTGKMWDDGVYSGIHEIIVVYDEDAIVSIDIEYDYNGSRFWLEHGGSTGSRIEKIQLDYPREILTSISGSYDTYGIRRLTFKSDLKEYGPYGMQRFIGTDFSSDDSSSPNSDVKIVGFHGRSDEYLRSIGVYLSNLHTAVPP